MKVPWTRPSIGAEEVDAASKVLGSGWLSQGPEVEAFEKEICNYIGCKYAVAVANGTVALILAHLALRNFKLEMEGYSSFEEDRHIAYVPSSTFAATANAAIVTGMNVFPVDVSPVTLLSSDDHFEDAYFKHRDMGIRPIFTPVHLMGSEASITRLSTHGDVVEDACQAFGTWGKEGRVGESSRLCVFSFHMAKLVSTVEGGCIVTNDVHLKAMLVNIRNQGLGQGYKIVRVGINGRMTDVHASIGRVQLKKAEKAIIYRRKLAELYKERFKKYGDRIHVVEPPKDNLRPVYAMLAVRHSDAQMLQQVLRQGGVDARRFFPPIETQYPQLKHTKSFYSTPERLHEEILLLPMGNAITEDEVSYVCDRIEEFIR